MMRTGKSSALSLKMSFRVERVVSEQDVIVMRVSGRIRAEDVLTLGELLGREKGKVVIDLTEVSLVDRETVKFLSVSEANGVELRNCPDYIREWVARERRRGDRSTPQEGRRGR
jgi:hypothetical protein